MTPAERQRDYRRRKREGSIVVTTEVNGDMLDALVDGGYLEFSQSSNRRAVAEAVGQKLRDA